MSSVANKQHPRDLILLGGSAGAIEGLRNLLHTLPPEFPAALLVVIHTSAEGPGLLPKVLGRETRLPTAHAVDGERVQPGHIYVAPPDHHLTLGRDNRMRLRKGARENGSRPAIDPLFRSAASSGYASRSVGVLLSGFLDDGSAGMYAIRRRGGIGIVQDPKEALAEEMPLRALAYAGADFVLPVRQIGAKLVELVDGTGKVVPMKKPTPGPAQGRASSQDPAEHPPNEFVAYTDEGEGTPSPFACPECHGVLWEIMEGGSVRYKCRTGHAYSEATLNDELGREAETALWAAMRTLEEKASMARRMADSAAGPETWKQRLWEDAESYAKHAETLRQMIFGEPPASLEISSGAPRHRAGRK